MHVEKKIEWWLPGAMGSREWEVVVFNGCNTFQFCKMKRVPEIGCITM